VTRIGEKRERVREQTANNFDNEKNRGYS